MTPYVEVARQLNLSIWQVRRSEQSAIRKLRRALAGRLPRGVKVNASLLRALLGLRAQGESLFEPHPTIPQRWRKVMRVKVERYHPQEEEELR